MAGIGADEWINSRLFWRNETDLLRFSRLQQRAFGQHFVRLWNVLQLGETRLLRVRLGQQSNFFESARLSDDEVVRHQVAVVEQKFDRLPGRNHDDVLVERHFFKDRTDLDHTNTQFAESRADFLRFVNG